MSELDATEKLRVLHDFYRAGQETEFHLDLVDSMRKGHGFRRRPSVPTALNLNADISEWGNGTGGYCFYEIMLLLSRIAWLRN